MKKLNPNIGGALFALMVISGLLCKSNVFAGQPSATEINPEVARVLTNTPPPGFATRLDYLKSFTSEKDIINAYHAGLITNEVEIMMALAALGNKASMDTYGKVIDQNGQPVVGVKVQGYLHLGFGDSEEHDTETDAHGLFHFLGVHGQGLNADLHKEGYDFNYMLPSAHRPKNYLPDPNNPLVFTMWKLHGPEPMVHSEVHAYIPCDGSVTKFDLLTGKRNPNGDLIVNLTRSPVNIDRRRPFNWSVKVEIPDGGFEAITNLYPNEAPSEGYEPIMTLDFPTNMVGWQPDFYHAFYFKSKSGQVYGRMKIHIMANFQPPPTLFDVEIYANPASSRNLEFDPKKQIR